MSKIIEVKINLKGIYTMGDMPWIDPSSARKWNNWFKNQCFNDGSKWIFWKAHASEYGTSFLTCMVAA